MVAVPAAVTHEYLLPNLDAAAFRRDILQAAASIGEPGEEDAEHLRWMVMKVQACSLVGHALLFATAIAHAVGASSALLTGLCAVSAMVLISTGRSMAWAIVGHHTMHGGYTSLANDGMLSSKWRRGSFATGMAGRLRDWLDWMMPEAWNLEHNKLHHYQLSEDGDPDVVERNFQAVRDLPGPLLPKFMFLVFFWMPTWKYTYYSPNTLKQLRLSQPQSFVARNWPDREPKVGPPMIAMTFPIEFVLSFPRLAPSEAVFWLVFWLDWLYAIAPMALWVVGPSYVIQHSAALCPGFWSAIVPATDGSAAAGSDAAIEAAALTASWAALYMSIAADCLSNIHSWIIIVCNHTGDDLYRFSTPCSPNGAEFLLRCSYAGVNFECGTEWVDVLYGWLNYQIEHHMFPDMTPLQYRKVQPLVKEICEKHGVLYIQENALWRSWKSLMIAAGGETMQQAVAVLPPAVEAASQFSARLAFPRDHGRKPRGRVSASPSRKTKAQ